MDVILWMEKKRIKKSNGVTPHLIYEYADFNGKSSKYKIYRDKSSLKTSFDTNQKMRLF